MPDYHHGDLRNALIVEAGRILEEEGPDAVTLRGLARRLGVSHAAPGYHFDDRDLLLVELAAEGHEMLEASMRRALEDADDESAIVAIGIGYLRFALDHPNRFRLTFGCAGLEPERSERFVEASTTTFRTLLTVAGGGPEATAEEQLAGPWLRAWAVVHGMATLFIDGAVGPYRGQRDRAMDVAVAELRAMFG